MSQKSVTNKMPFDRHEQDKRIKLLAVTCSTLAILGVYVLIYSFIWKSWGRIQLKNFGLSFALKNSLRFHFVSETCTNFLCTKISIV